MSRYFTKKITTDELSAKIIEAFRKNPDYERDMDFAAQEFTIYGLEDEIGWLDYTGITSKVEKDLSKVDFDTENITAMPQGAYGEAVAGQKLGDYVGLHTLDNGLSYLGITAGGDWESPIFFMIYHDGHELRGYIPEEGNTWNRKVKSAFGNYEDEDAEALAELGLSDSYDLRFDFKKIESDIKDRIIYKP